MYYQLLLDPVQTTQFINKIKLFGDEIVFRWPKINANMNTNMNSFLSCHRVLYRPVAIGVIRRQFPLNVCAPPNFAVPRRICFKHTVETKILPPKNVLYHHPDLKTWLRTCF